MPQVPQLPKQPSLPHCFPLQLGTQTQTPFWQTSLEKQLPQVPPQPSGPHALPLQFGKQHPLVSKLQPAVQARLPLARGPSTVLQLCPARFAPSHCSPGSTAPLPQLGPPPLPGAPPIPGLPPKLLPPKLLPPKLLPPKLLPPKLLPPKLPPPKLLSPLPRPPAALPPASASVPASDRNPELPPEPHADVNRNRAPTTRCMGLIVADLAAEFPSSTPDHGSSASQRE
jgi:hypothetical protein